MKELETVIEELSASSGKSKEEIISELTAFAKIKFSNPFTAKEGAIIKLVQEKLIKGLYRMSEHSYVTSRPDYRNKFGFDNLEMNYLKQAGDELEVLGYLEGNDNYTKLTDPGVLKAKELLGEL